MRDDLKGVCAALGAAVLFGAGTPVAKIFLAEVRPLPLSALLYLGAALGLVLLPRIFLALRKPGSETPIQRRDAPVLAAVILFGGVLGPLLMLTGLSRVSGLVGSLALNLEAPLTILLAVAFFGEHLSVRAATAGLCIVFGVVLLSANGGNGADSTFLGVLWVSLACLCWSIDNNLTQRLSLRDPVALSRAKCLGAGATSFALCLLFGEPLPGADRLFPALLLGFVSYGLSLVLAVQAMRLLGAARQAALFAVAPFAGALLSVPLLGDQLGTRELMGMLATALGAVLLLREGHEHLHTHVELEHEHAHVHDEHHQHVHLGNEPLGERHAHLHRHEPVAHSHEHRSDAHHRHRHDRS